MLNSWEEMSGSINIALNEIPERIEELKNLKAPLILCCASGNRSGQAQHFLSQHGIECYNGGGWLDVNIINLKQQNKMINTLKKNYLASDLKWITRHY
jgi:rhodanese-related sulfurtransferase